MHHAGYNSLKLTQRAHKSETILIRNVYETDCHSVDVRGTIPGGSKVKTHKLGGQNQDMSIGKVDNQLEWADVIRQFGDNHEGTGQAQINDLSFDLI